MSTRLLKNEYINLSKAAKMLKVARETIYVILETYPCEVKKVGRIKYFPKEHIEKLKKYIF